MEQSLSWAKLRVTQLLKKFPAFYRTQRFITMFTRAHQVQDLVLTFHYELVFYSDELLAPCPTPRLEDHPLSAVCNCLLNIFTATLHIWRLYSPSITEDTQCRSDRDLHNMAIFEVSVVKRNNLMWNQQTKVFMTFVYIGY